MKENNFSIIKCTESGRGFIEGEYYAVVGWNSGEHVISTNSEGNVREFLLHDYCDCEIDDEGRQISDSVKSWLAPANGEETPKFEHVEFAPVVHGHWVELANRRGQIVLECSVCKCRIHKNVHKKFCPGCGAKMDEEADRNNDT